MLVQGAFQQKMLLSLARIFGFLSKHLATEGYWYPHHSLKSKGRGFYSPLLFRFLVYLPRQKSVSVRAWKGLERTYCRGRPSCSVLSPFVVAYNQHSFWNTAMFQPASKSVPNPFMLCQPTFVWVTKVLMSLALRFLMTFVQVSDAEPTHDSPKQVFSPPISLPESTSTDGTIENDNVSS